MDINWQLIKRFVINVTLIRFVMVQLLQYRVPQFNFTKPVQMENLFLVFQDIKLNNVICVPLVTKICFVMVLFNKNALRFLMLINVMETSLSVNLVLFFQSINLNVQLALQVATVTMAQW